MKIREKPFLIKGEKEGNQKKNSYFKDNIYWGNPCDISSSSLNNTPSWTLSFSSATNVSKVVFVTLFVILRSRGVLGDPASQSQSSSLSLLSQVSLNPNPLRSSPYYNAELYKVLRQHYKFQDLLSAGSGEGPVESERDGDGMAWEDDHDQGGGTKGEGQVIKVTKTMVLYKTVLSTVYPVAMTPMVVTSTISISITPSFDFGIPESSSVPSPWEDVTSSPTTLIGPTPTMTLPTTVQPTATVTPPTSSSTTEEIEQIETLNDRLAAATNDPRYWIQTTIKRKKRDKHSPDDLEFQSLMQRRLASIYATAFKRQLLKALTLNNVTKKTGKRYRRSMMKGRGILDFEEDEDEEGYLNDLLEENSKPLYYYLRGTQGIAKTAMNVSVLMRNVTWNDTHVVLEYVVYAEGNPVQGFIAAKELKAVSIPEMEQKLGYDVAIQAEALVQPMERHEVGSVGSTTPWMIALLVLVCLMIVVLALTFFMAWKWRNNRLRADTGGESSRVPGVAGGPHTSSPASRQSILGAEGGSMYSRVTRGSPASLERRREPKKVPSPIPPPTFERGGRVGEERAVSTSVEEEEGEDKSILAIPHRPSDESSSYHSHASPQRQTSKFKTSAGVARKINRRRHRSKQGTGPEPRTKESQKITSPSSLKLIDSRPEDTGDFSFTGEITRNMDKISFGNLEIYTQNERASSAKSKIRSRPSSHELKKQQGKPPAEEEGREDEELQTKETKESEDYTRDAEAQTPTRLKKRNKSPRLRTSPRHRARPRAAKTKTSLTSTESEEATTIPEVNPIGRIRKRFHQFLDDAFNVMATTRKESTSPTKHPQSAKLTVSHQVQSRAPGRPWTSVIREESVRKIRPKSSVVGGVGPPKPAWTATSERRCQSAKSKASSSVIEEAEDITEIDDLDEPEQQEEYGKHKSRSQSFFPEQSLPSSSSHTHTSSSYIFPKYPTYPEVELYMENEQQDMSALPGTSQGGMGRSIPTLRRLHPHHPLDPAVPLIEAIKDEMKRFEKTKVSTERT